MVYRVHSCNIGHNVTVQDSIIASKKELDDVRSVLSPVKQDTQEVSLHYIVVKYKVVNT